MVELTASDYVDNLGTQVLFPNSDAIFQENSTPIHTARSVQSWFEEHENALQHLWLAHSPNLNIIEPLWSVLESRVRSRFLPPSSLKQPKMPPQSENCMPKPLLLVYILPVVVVTFIYHFLQAPHKILSQKHMIYWRISGTSQTEFIKCMPTFVSGHCHPLEIPLLIPT